jgi:hypothetical protein
MDFNIANLFKKREANPRFFGDRWLLNDRDLKILIEQALEFGFVAFQKDENVL